MVICDIVEHRIPEEVTNNNTIGYFIELIPEIKCMIKQLHQYWKGKHGNGKSTSSEYE